MKFASFSMFAVLSLLAGMVALSGCGANNNLALTPGNWSMTAVPSSGAAGTFYIGGNLTQNGSSLAGTMYFVSSNCITSSQTVTFTGTVKGKSVTLTSDSVGGEVVSITASGTSGSALTGNYSIAGGIGCNGDTGSLTANPVPSISGTWGGLILTQNGISQGGANAALAIALTQAATASSDGTFALTGSGTFTNSTCFQTATITAAFIAGPYLVVEGNTDDGGSYSYQQVLLNNPASPTSMTGTYSVSNPGGNCDGDLDEPTFTKQ
jgi:hypothetical protein